MPASSKLTVKLEKDSNKELLASNHSFLASSLSY
nr:MAG TPA: hypothetical protein [Caudoviricetes sp.]